jgi:hypothetical protein
MRLVTRLFNRFNRLFGCRHRRIGTPVTRRSDRVTSVFCQECGQRIAYDFGRMRQGGVIE